MLAQLVDLTGVVASAQQLKKAPKPIPRPDWLSGRGSAGRQGRAGGGVTRDESGRIVAARGPLALAAAWGMRVDQPPPGQGGSG